MSATDPNGPAYRLAGPEGAPVVVLIHGLGLNQDLWQWLAPGLGRHFRVLTYDLCGHGQSHPPAGQPGLADLSGQLAALMDHLGIARAAVVGFSLGGMVARRFAQDWPGRCLALGVLNSPHRRSPAQQEAVRARVAEARQGGPASTIDAALARWFTDECRRARPGLMALVRDWVVANDPAVYPRLYQVFAEGVEEVCDPDPPLACPALVLTGDQDLGNSPDMARAIAGAIPGARLVVLPGLRHMALVEDAPTVNRAVMDFLGEVLR